MKIRIRILLLIITGLTTFVTVCSATPVDEAGSFHFYYENDAFANSDKNYTNAVKFAWISEDREFDDKLNNLIPDNLPFFGVFLNRKDMQRSFGISFGQNIYTPQNIDTSELLENDRPYAGLTYIALALHRKNRTILDTMELNLGIIGPASFAEDAQRYVHDAIDVSNPLGWDHQLENEPGFALTVQRSYRLASDGLESGWGWDLIPHVGITAGTFTVYANTGAAFRFGYQVPLDFGTALIRPGGNVSVPGDHSENYVNQWRSFSITTFLTAEGRAVAHNILLDGNTWKDSHSVDKKPLVADYTAGLSMIYKNFKLTYAHVYRTREFEAQKKGHSFGSVSVSVIY